jgi:alpha-beta hydrolase superfamily lysophospholipase
MGVNPKESAMVYHDKIVQSVICPHSESLGSSADVFERNIEPLAKAGLWVIAYDEPGFGLTDTPADFSVNYRRKFIRLVQWDAMDEFHKLASAYLPN